MGRRWKSGGSECQWPRIDKHNGRSSECVSVTVTHTHSHTDCRSRTGQHPSAATNFLIKFFNAISLTTFCSLLLFFSLFPGCCCICMLNCVCIGKGHALWFIHTSHKHTTKRDAGRGGIVGDGRTVEVEVAEVCCLQANNSFFWFMSALGAAIVNDTHSRTQTENIKNTTETAENRQLNILKAKL